MIQQSTLDPAGPGAASIAGLWWLMFWTCSVVYVLVMVALVLADAMLEKFGGDSMVELSRALESYLDGLEARRRESQ